MERWLNLLMTVHWNKDLILMKFCHWMHWRLSFQQSPVLPVTKYASKWHYHFSVKVSKPSSADPLYISNANLIILVTADVLVANCAQPETSTPDSKVHGANMGPIWGRQDPGGPHVGPMNFAIWDSTEQEVKHRFFFNFAAYQWLWVYLHKPADIIHYRHLDLASYKSPLRTD